MPLHKAAAIDTQPAVISLEAEMFQDPSMGELSACAIAP